jgi:hypothetical protein
VLAIEQRRPAIYNIVDDEPAHGARVAAGARPGARREATPHAPTWLARLLAGKAVVVMATEAGGASNAKAKRELGWTLRYPSWRQGFPEVYAGSTASAAPRIGEPART